VTTARNTGITARKNRGLNLPTWGKRESRKGKTGRKILGEGNLVPSGNFGRHDRQTKTKNTARTQEALGKSSTRGEERRGLGIHVTKA